MSDPAASTATTATTATAAPARPDQYHNLPPMPLLPITSPSTIHRCKHLRTDGRDIFICSYPKSGTTWAQAIVRALIMLRTPASSSSSIEPEGDWHITEYCPFFEADRTWRPDTGAADDDDEEPFAPLYRRRQQETGRRAYNTHLRWDMMPTEGGEDARFLYLVRDGRDVAVSYFHHMRSMAVEDGGFEGSWDAFFEAWCEGRVAFGAWLDHLLSWRGGPAAADPRVLFLRYEDLKADLKAALAAVAAHIRLDPLPTEAELEAAARQCSLDGMRAERRRYEPRSVVWRDPEFLFIRKGAVGDHAALFTPEQHARFAAGLLGRYRGICGRDGAGQDVVLPAFVTGALVGGKAGLRRALEQRGE